MKRYVFEGIEYTNIETVTAVANGKCLGMEAMLRHKKCVTLPCEFRRYMDYKERYMLWACSKKKRKQSQQDFLLDGAQRLKDHINTRSTYLRACKDYYELRKKYREAKELLRYFRTELLSRFAEAQDA